MSDIPKPTEETTTVATAPAEAATASEPTAATGDITSAETPAAASAAEEPKTDGKEEAAESAESPKPASEGVMGYKAPGVIKGFRFSEKFFWFGKEAIETKDLTSYLRGEKPDIAHPAVAWSTQTGEGLLYFSKTESKTQPTGVIKLADVSDVLTDGLYEFYIKLNGHKHSFRTNAGPERDAWVTALKTKVDEAKKLAESIVNSDGYKENIEKLGKPAVVTPTPKTEATPKKSTEKAPEGVKKDNASGSDGERKPSRSVSRKRASIFAFMKKEDVEEKKEGKEDDKTSKGEDAKPEEAAAAEPTVTAAEPAKTEEPATATEQTTEPAADHKDTPKPSKRASLLGIFLGKGAASPAEEKKEAAPVVPVKEAETAPASEPVDAPAKPAEPAEEPPVIASTSPKKGAALFGFLKKHVEKKEETEPAKAEPAKTDEPAEAAETTPAAETETPVAAETSAETTEPAAPVEPKTRRRSSFFTDLVGKVGKKPGDVTSDSETEPKEKSSPSSSLPKFHGLFRGKSHREPKKDESKKETTPPPTVEEASEPAPTESKDAAPAVESKPEENHAAAEPSQTNVVNGAIGDVVGDAITVGQTPQQVQAAA
ncbi:hypothetical protein FGG08_000899 [Glutinoglossum americanum]|uniref:Meiotic expression up-regulated protein 6 PH domain-containing protein n=1 Tax=Glutinoglossum americanum TaxID=1670608 RepID=A0A9P8IHK6_9PEZI|nr:hypothetical protein FGG08_000899 [Glutinoglossum americanum]